MKAIIRLFFRLVRRLVGPVMLFIEWLTTPKGVQRSTEEQEKIDNDTQNMILYQFKTCPFCIKVRRHTRRLSLNIKTHDAQHDSTHRAQLLNGGGKILVPCLRITSETGEDSWMYESDDIIHYLNSQFGQPPQHEQSQTTQN